MTGPSSILEGADGFYAVYTDNLSAPVRLREHLNTLGERWHFREGAVKARACCHYIQPFLECLEGLLSRGVDPEAIEAIHCEVPIGEETLICEPWAEKLRPSTAYQAKFSLPYALAALLLDGAVTVASFEGPARAQVCALADIVTWSPMADGDFPNRYGARVTVTTRCNDRFTAEVKDVRGTPERPFSKDEALRKFYDCALPVLCDDAPERLAEAVEHLERVRNLAALTSALRCVR